MTNVAVGLAMVVAPSAFVAAATSASGAVQAPPPPTITVQKALGGSRAKDADQFTVLIGSGGTTVSDPTHGTTTGSGSTVDPGTGTTGTFAATTGTDYVVDETAGNPDTHLDSYTATVTCTDANGLQQGLPTDAPLVPGTGAAITPVAGAAITCTIENGVRRGTIRVQKALGDERLAPTDQFKVNVTSQEPDTKGQVINDQTHATTTGSGSTVDPGTGDTGTTDARDGKVMVTEDFPGHRYDGSLTCTDRNGVVAGTPEQIGRRYYGDTTTVPRGAALECTLTNVQSKPFLILRKSMGGLRVQDSDQFTVAVEQGGTIVSDQFVATTTGTGASIPGPGGITFYRDGTGGQTYGFTELPSGTTDLANYTATITCSDVTGLQPDLPTNAPLGGTFTITARNATQVDCTITNTPKVQQPPVLAVTKTVVGGPTPDHHGGFDIAYDVTVTNTGGAGTYDLHDALRYGTGIAVGTTGISAAAGSPTPSTTWNGTTDTTVVTGATIATNATHTFHVSAKALPGSSATPASMTCAADPATAGGLDNSATVDSGQQHLAAYACKPLTTTVLVQEALGGSRVAGVDQFTVDIKAGGNVVSDPTNATTNGTGADVVPGTGTTGTYAATPGTALTVGEAEANPSTKLSRWNAALTCVDADGTTAGLPVGLVLGGQAGYTATFTPGPGAAITCTYTNTPKPGTVTVQKALGGPRTNPTDQFEVQIADATDGAGGPTVGDQSHATTTGNGATVDPGSGTTGPVGAPPGRTLSVREVGPAGYTSTLACTDVNGIVTGPPLQIGELFSRDEGVAMLDGTDFRCTLTNTPTPVGLGRPTLSVQAALAGDRVHAGDQFTVGVASGGGIVSDTTRSTTTGTGAVVDPGTGTTGTYDASTGATYTVVESAAAGADLSRYDAAVTCADANGLQPGLPTGQPYTGPIAIVPVADAAITCTITDTPKPAVATTQTTSRTVPPTSAPTGTTGSGSTGTTGAVGTVGNGTTGGLLARTGAKLGMLAGLGSTLVAVGFLLTTTRRRRPAHLRR